MQVNATNAAAQAGATGKSSASTAASVDYNAFLKLLIAQMKNQDPSNPTDATQYMSQLASFSNVEQTIQINTKLESLLASSALSQGEGLIGRNITFEDGSISGKVTGIKLVSGGAVAILEDGTRVLIGEGITVSEP
ncbi:flagellar hook assembly protein FlgD [soil metagenome]